MSELEPLFSALAYSARPGVVDWDALRQQLQRSSPLSNSDRLSLLLAAANTGQLSAAQWRALIGLPVSKEADESVVHLPEPAVAWLRSHLETIVAGPRARISQLREEAAAAITGRVVLAPVTKQGRMDHVVIADGIRGALFFAMLVVIDSHLEGQHHVCRCSFSKCGRYFLKRFPKGPGAPKRRYCTNEHATLGDREQAQQRMKRLRVGKKRQKDRR